MTKQSGVLLFILICYSVLSSWSAWRRPDDLTAQLRRQRTRFFLVNIIVQWTLTGACLFVVQLDGQAPEDIGFRLFGGITQTFGAGLDVTLSLAVVLLPILWLQRKCRWPEAEMVKAMLPETREEKAVFMLVAATAGFCEETLFRGVAITRLTLLTDAVWLAVLIAVIMFSAGHYYQGAIGLLRTGLLAAALSLTFVITGSLLPGIMAHFLLDALAGFWGRKLLGIAE